VIARHCVSRAVGSDLLGRYREGEICALPSGFCARFGAGLRCWLAGDGECQVNSMDIRAQEVNEVLSDPGPPVLLLAPYLLCTQGTW